MKQIIRDHACLNGTCADHRLDLVIANTEHFTEIQSLRFYLYASWAIFGIVISGLIFFRNIYGQ